MRRQSRQEKVALPGLATFEPTLVDGLVERVNRIDRERGLDMARRIGTAILTTFFRNQGDLFTAHCGSHVSFRSLADRDDLELSHATLYRYTAVEVQVRTMPLELATALSLTHHVALLPLRDPAERIGFAIRAIREKWPSRVLRARVQAERKTSPRTGRPPLPEVFKASRGVHRALRCLRELPQHELEALDHAEVERLLQELHDAQGRLSKVVRAPAG